MKWLLGLALAIGFVSGCRGDFTIEGGKVGAGAGSGERLVWVEASASKLAEHRAVKELGLPIYPNAKAEMPDAWIQEQPGKRMVQVILRTPDSVEQVQAFYLKHLPGAKAYPQTSVESPGDSGANVVYGPKEERRVIHIYRGADTQMTNIAAHWLKDCDMAPSEWEE